MSTTAPIVIDVISDVMCPWCFIGKRRLEKALMLLPQSTVKVQWHPYQLDATLPKEGKDRKKYLEDKFGGEERAKEIYAQVRAAGAAEEINFQFEAIKKAPNTIDSHRLIRWARSESMQDAIVEELFKLYFTEGEDLTDKSVLLDAADRAGLNSELISELLDTNQDVKEIESDVNRAHEIGVTGVPFFIIDGRFAVAGAETPETLAATIRHAEETKSGE
ncbi:DSBA-like thioredoxin domain protein [Pseudovibrio axinellae]|uniref:DSBA-like thioredoxin domain protein n=1 Tax=Pseudovibrio axinellae TaxID=989403 RepID=A0A165YPE2_9HYPH|nr:DsbA family oxidoreductase [Pseudovibrio axinellae]KZL19096.1 DSBA-like thioredoxin domain protein [Pseudovibrio axinellae]SER33196.1 Predicted dithiol-disulfide isomerase, DsbA family [Pseudovibrio axinellae]